jgi:hypothetical protein
MTRKRPTSSGQLFKDLPLGLTHALFLKLTLVGVGVTLLLSGITYFVSQNLVSRQIAGTVRVLNSLGRESTALDKQWRAGELPAAVLQTEQQNISEESSRASEELDQLRSQNG